jgi:hypothetical protein
VDSFYDVLIEWSARFEDEWRRTAKTSA